MNVVVKPKGAAVPATPEEVAAQSEGGDRRRLGEGRRHSSRRSRPTNTIYMGVESAQGERVAGRPCSTSSRT